MTKLFLCNVLCVTLSFRGLTSSLHYSLQSLRTSRRSVIFSTREIPPQRDFYRLPTIDLFPTSSTIFSTPKFPPQHTLTVYSQKTCFHQVPFGTLKISQGCLWLPILPCFWPPNSRVLTVGVFQQIPFCAHGRQIHETLGEHLLWRVAVSVRTQTLMSVDK